MLVTSLGCAGVCAAVIYVRWGVGIMRRDKAKRAAALRPFDGHQVTLRVAKTMNRWIAYDYTGVLDTSGVEDGFVGLRLHDQRKVFPITQVVAVNQVRL